MSVVRPSEQRSQERTPLGRRSDRPRGRWHSVASPFAAATPISMRSRRGGTGMSLAPRRSMLRSILIGLVLTGSVCSLALACGGSVASTSSSSQPSDDAGSPSAPASDAGRGTPASDSGAPPDGRECHGYCPQPNGSECVSDCDCYEKCLSGTDRPARCATPIAPTIECADGAVCPSGQSCTAGICTGSACGSTDDCPPRQQCVAAVCTLALCL